jgi:hypothetical protein
MTYDAPTLKRSMQNTWLFDLKPFVAQVRALGDVQAAEILVNFGEKSPEVSLFTLLRYPEFENFHLSLIASGEQCEKYYILWTAQSNDPVTNRVLVCRPMTTPAEVIERPLANGALPPIEITLEAPQEGGLWQAHCDIRRSRFGHHRSVPDSLVTPYTWFRAPKGWYDWLAWYALPPEEIHGKVSNIKSLPHDKRCTILPFYYFMEYFHYGLEPDSFQNIQGMIGDALLISLLPYAKNQIWEAKTFAKTCLTFTVISSSLSHVPMSDVFRGRPPAQWYKSPDMLHLTLRQHQAHLYLGHAGGIWQYHKTPEERDPIMTSDEEGELELRSWLEDAIHPAERGELLARCPLEKVWDRPPFLPLSDMVPLKDRHFPSLTYSSKKGREPVRRSYAPRDRLTIPLMSLIDEQSREALYRRTSESTDLAMGKQAQRLLAEWERSVNRPEINKLLTRMIIG